MTSRNKFIFYTCSDKNNGVTTFFSVFAELKLIPKSLINSTLSSMNIKLTIEDVIKCKHAERLDRACEGVANQYVRENLPFVVNALKQIEKEKKEEQ